MNWYQGNIAEAVNLSKTNNSIFVVFVQGTDELSRTFTELLNHESIKSHLEGKNFVAIKIESSSEAYMQFAQIYQLVPLPSLFFIGKSGTPIEVVTGATTTVEELDSKIKSILEKSGVSSGASSSLISSEQSAASSSSVDVPKEEKVEKFKKPEVSHEEKLQKAKELIEKTRRIKDAQEAEERRQKEMERRKQGQDSQDLKKWQEDQEMKQLKEDRKREKEEEQSARKRILEQIAQDRAERSHKFGGANIPVTPKEPETKPVTSTPRQDNSEFARIQFKKPGGETEMHTFSSSDSFQTLRAYVQNNILASTGIRDFKLATTFPKRDYTSADNGQTLSQLGLSPTAVLLILPIGKTGSNNQSVTASNGGVLDTFSTFLWTVLTPVIAMFGYLRNLVFNRGAAPGTDNATTGAQKRASEETYTANDAAKKRNLNFGNQNKSSSEPSTSKQTGPTYKRAGANVHRLRENKDSDEENNTWNGNSTQQQ